MSHTMLIEKVKYSGNLSERAVPRDEFYIKCEFCKKRVMQGDLIFVLNPLIIGAKVFSGRWFCSETHLLLGILDVIYIRPKEKRKLGKLGKTNPVA